VAVAVVLAVVLVMARRMARRVMVREMRSGSRLADWAALARAAWVSWCAQSSAQISCAVPAGSRDRRTRPAPRWKIFSSR
jgi:hypothetical protein